MMISSHEIMHGALEQAELAQRAGEVPIGAVIVDGAGTLLASAHNLVETQHDISAHAEMLVIRDAANKRGTKFLEDCSLYVTLEPCAMCAQAIAFARIKRLYFGAYDPKGGGVEYGATIFRQPTTHHTPEIYGGIMEQECAHLLKEFFAQKRLD
jgi:tRNA(adenine34) deaminase